MTHDLPEIVIVVQMVIETTFHLTGIGAFLTLGYLALKASKDEL